MKNTLTIVFGISAALLAAGLLGSTASAYPGFGIMGINSGMMGAGFGAGGMMNAGFMQSMMGNAGFKNMMNGNLDMNAMHRAMHGENSSVDMNAMHKRMLAGNLTSGDFKEMKEQCPMMN